MPWVKKHRRSRRTTRVRSHYRTPPWVRTFLFWVGLIVVAALATKYGYGK